MDKTLFLRAILPAILLSLVAAYQIHLTRTADLNPWKGGGFGMFSSALLKQQRYLRIYVSAPERSEELLIPDSLRKLASKTETLPSAGFLEKLSQELVKDEISKNQPVANVRIEVWQTEFDRKTLISGSHIIREYDYDVERQMGKTGK